MAEKSDVASPAGNEAVLGSQGPSGSAPRFADTFCSQCGKSLGPGDHGVSHCDQHLPKVAPTLSFLGGKLTIRQSGYRDRDGSAFFTFNEDEVDIRPHDEKSGCYYVSEVDASELIELRDFISKHYPPAAPDLLEALTDLLPFLEDAETKLLVGDEGCVWAVEKVRAAIAKAEGR